MSDPRYAHEFVSSRTGLCKYIVGGSICHLPEDAVVHERGGRGMTDAFNIIVYLKGRREYLKAQTRIWPSGCSKHNCAQARLFEVQELLALIEETTQGEEVE